MAQYRRKLDYAITGTRTAGIQRCVSCASAHAYINIPWYTHSYIYIYIHISTEPYFPWIHRDRLSAAFRIFRVFHAPFRVFRVLQRRLLFRAFRVIPRHSAPRLSPRQASDSARRGIIGWLVTACHRTNFVLRKAAYWWWCWVLESW